MKVLVVLCGLLALSSALPRARTSQRENPCDPAKCKLPNCQCSSVNIPGGLKPENTPQFVLLTFDDAVSTSNIEYYREALYDMKNPDGCPAAATFFVTHEYTDYSFLHELHANGQEIALHSITHQTVPSYWKNASVELLNKEFGDMRKTVQKFASIPIEDIKGIRMPFLQMAGNNQFQMLNDSGFLYDLSWPTRRYLTPGLWPYTTEYDTIQDCVIGPCPDKSFPGKWVIPMINWIDENGNVCSMVDACVNNPKNESSQIFSWIKEQFDRHYYGNRAPFGFYVHAAWFNNDEPRYEAYLQFLDYINNITDVFAVSASRAIDWVKNPISVENMLKPDNIKCQKTYPPKCTPTTCKLKKENKEERWMTSCVSQCPKSYPWLGNPLGEL